MGGECTQKKVIRKSREHIFFTNCFPIMTFLLKLPEAKIRQQANNKCTHNPYRMTPISWPPKCQKTPLF